MEWKAPKSVRQIGDTKGKTKIYVEDYVMSFARRMAKEKKEPEAAGVLLGHRFYHAREKVFLISGMVSIHDFDKRENASFSQDMWTSIYTEIKENFTDLDVVGWFYSGDTKLSGNADRLLEIHRRNFSERDKLLYIYNENEKDEFSLYENSSFVKQKGYYIYYEKNAEMRRYMMEEANRFVHIVEQEDDRVLRNIRGVIRENEEKKKNHETENKWTFGLASLVIVLGLILGASALNNQIGLKELKNQMTGLQSTLMGNKKEQTTVETIGGGVVSGPAVSPQAVDAQAVSIQAVNVTEGGVEGDN